MNSPRLLAVFSLILIGACAPPWTTLQQSGPPPALQGAQYVSLAFNFAELEIDGQPVAQVIATLAPDERADLEGAFMDMQNAFMEEFSSRVGVPVQSAAAPPGQGEVRAEVAFTFIQRGTRGPIGFSNTEVMVQVRWSVSGQPTDAIEMLRISKPAMTRPSVAQRMRICASQLGSLTARFFEREQGRQ